MQEHIAELIQEAHSIYQKNMPENKEAAFNLLTVSGTAMREVQMCRLLGELLNPKGRHGCGITFLKLFYENVLDIAFSDEELSKARIELEYAIENDRRIDIVILVPGVRFVPIEVKIDAYDQQNQCADYLKHAHNAKLYYLTPDGRQPSEYSIAGAERKRIEPIAWGKDIYPWLKKCSEDTSENLRPVFDQLLEAVDCISHVTEGKIVSEISDVITESKQNIRAALETEKALHAVRAGFVTSIFDKVVDCMKHASNIPDSSFASLGDYASKAKAYYENHTNTHPNVSFLLKESADDDYRLYLRLELSEKMYAGIVITDAKGEDADYKRYKDVDLIKSLTDHRASGCWLDWEWCHEGKPDFRNCNEAYLELYGEKGQPSEKTIAYYADCLIEYWNKAKEVIRPD